ncbi:hypothetical protein [Jannaschia donghaensis]|uniref:B12 binding domain protein n=1 Tax=Jannaschia donghaensis TaxID=420998 RepID=A0A0M6YDF8_9RHOB|nr:hypothetical protein [Jannaschia donghaensis]CTQ48010.1 B12 binding domain protein [Jannaschia donghaensis]
MRKIAIDLEPQARHDMVLRLSTAVVSPDPDTWRQVVTAMIDDGCRLVDLIDVYVPAVARRLGADWVTDRSGFAHVTIGSARLRDILNWADQQLDDLDLAPDLPHGRIYLVRPVGGQHRLGQQVFAAQLLRHGVAAQILRDDATVSDADIVMISASGQESLATLRATVERARNLGPAPRVLLGGGGLELAKSRCMAAGADVVTNDLDLALSECRNPDRRTRGTS